MTARQEQLREAQRRYRLKHPDRVRQAQKAWRIAHPEKTEERRARYMATHREEVNAKRRAKGKDVRAKSKDYMRQYLADYYADPRNKEIMKQRGRDHYQKNKAIAIERQRLWREANPDGFRIWAAKNPDKTLANVVRRRARLAGAPINDFTGQQWITVQAFFDHRCVYCNRKFKGRLTQDHIVPLSKGGSHTASNIVPACKSCNCKKNVGPPLRPVQPMMLP